MSQNGQTYFKNLAENAAKFVCLIILGHTRCFFFKKHKFKKHEAQNGEILRNI